MNYYISDLHLFCTSQTQEGVNHEDLGKEWGWEISTKLSIIKELQES